MGKFEFFDHEADLGLLIEAPNLRILFAEAARALTACHTDLARVGLNSERRIAVGAQDREELLVRWLKEWLYLQNSEGFLVADVRFTALSRIRAAGVGLGEVRDPARHPARREIKAVTYSGATARRRGRIWQARLILDV